MFTDFFILKAAVVLFLFGFGYLVFVYASKQDKGLKTFGRLVGVLIIAVSLFIGISSLWKSLLLCRRQLIIDNIKTSCKTKI